MTGMKEVIPMATDRTAQYISTASDRMTRTRYGILATILLLATVAYADRAILSIAGPGIAKEFGLNHVQLGYVLSAFSWAYVVGQIPGGLLLDRFGTFYGPSRPSSSASSAMQPRTCRLRSACSSHCASRWD